MANISYTASCDQLLLFLLSRKLSNQLVSNVKVSSLDTSLSDFFISKFSNACLMFISIWVVCKFLLWDIIDDCPNRITTRLTGDIDVAQVYDQSTKVLNLLSGTYPPLYGSPPPHTLHPIESLVILTRPSKTIFKSSNSDCHPPLLRFHCA